ncbi:MAG: Two-component hybrid sensor and regulator [Candidatus Woesebacteria bacterium GW2011_GWB1_38_5b]|uniref:histidine kinase n=1 Tax=Candidatus Woesebacteria bacterium GW2011_GWB1_38_5b TaxID=1618569 RepID=A0A0G0MJA3_9BACT|nr:MAG: Two-component hybrid sensor and regulator [Candidatus Woesebacteria bacterium GW2011_GWB1_38_5b]
MDLLHLPFILKDTPLFNKAVIIPINFVALALVISVVNHRKESNSKPKIFILMTFIMLLWVDFAYLARVFGLYPDIAEIFLRIVWFVIPLSFYLIYLVSVHLTEQERKFKSLSYVLFVLSVALGLIAGIVNPQGEQLIPFLVGVLVLVAFTFYCVLKPKVSQPIAVFLFGVVTFFTANIIFNFIFPIFLQFSEGYYLGDYSTIFLLGFTAYAMLKLEAFDFRTFTAEIFTIIILSIQFTKLFFNNSPAETAIDLGVFISMVVFGVLLIRSVNKEVQERLKTQFLAGQLRELDARKDEFLSIATHELRAPMTAIKGYLSMLLDGDAGQLSPDAITFIKVMESSTDRLIRLVNNMLNIARIEQGRQVYQMGLVNLAAVVKSAFEEFQLDAKKKNLSYTLELQPDLDDRIYADLDRIHEVVGNLMSNGLKYTDQGSVAVRLFQPNKGIVRFEVTDSGMGIAPIDQTKIFQKYFRVEERMERKTGTGLGLYISKVLIEKFSGKIGFNSQIGKGSTFWFELPVAEKIENKPKVLV